MASVVSVVIHPSRMFREGLTRILAQSPFAPACAAASTKDVPSTISTAGEQVLVLIGVSEASNLAEALSATKASFPNAYVVVVGDATRRNNVTTALELGATSFVDENLATSSLVKELELVTLGEPVISVFILKQLLHRPAEFVATLAVDERQPTNALEQAEPRLLLQGGCDPEWSRAGCAKQGDRLSIADHRGIREGSRQGHTTQNSGQELDPGGDLGI